MTTPRNVWYLTEEDPEREVYQRFECLLTGRGVSSPPATLHVSVQRGLCIDDEPWQDDIICDVRDHAIGFIVFDPMRAFSQGVDQGPDKLRPVTLFLRRLIRETGVVVAFGHHDTKPPAGKPDDRAKPQRASGGGIFSIADAPIHLERLGDTNRTLVTPSHYKFALAPEPFIIALATDDSKNPTWARLTVEETAAASADDVSFNQRILDYLREHPGTSSSKVARGVHGNTQKTLNALGDLRRKGLADFFQRGQANLWSATATEVQE